MSDHWQEVTLEEACFGKGQYGFTASASLEASGPHLLRTTDITGRSVEWATVPRCEMAENEMRKYLLGDGDILICRMGSVGVSAFIESAPESVFASYLVRFKPNPDIVLPKYLGYILQSDMWWDYVEAVQSGTVQPTLNAAVMAGFTLRVPSVAQQADTVALLSAVDARLNALQRVQATLGDMVLAECEASVEDRSGIDTISLSKATRLVNGGAYTKDATGTGRMVIRIKELNSGPSESTVYNDITVPPEKTAFPGDVLFAWSGSLGVWRWFADEAIVNQHIFKVLPGEHQVWLSWFHILSELEAFRDIAAGKATTMGHITKDHLDRAQVPAFSTVELEALRLRVEPLWQYQLSIGRQAVALENMRAFLLPRLVTGDLRVQEVESLIEAAL